MVVDNKVVDVVEVVVDGKLPHSVEDENALVVGEVTVETKLSSGVSLTLEMLSESIEKLNVDENTGSVVDEGSLKIVVASRSFTVLIVEESLLSFDAEIYSLKASRAFSKSIVRAVVVDVVDVVDVSTSGVFEDDSGIPS